MKMEVPIFDGSDPTGWIFRVEEFFDFHRTPEPQRLRIASFHMEGRAAAWYQWVKNNHLITTWPVFLGSVRHRFGGSIYDDPQGSLSKLTQKSTVAEFQAEFEELMNRVEGISESLLVSFFVTDLQPDIHRELSFSKPLTLMEAFTLAKAHEARRNEARLEQRWTPRPPVKAVPISSYSPSTPSSSAPSPTPSIPMPSPSSRSANPPLLQAPPSSDSKIFSTRAPGET